MYRIELRPGEETALRTIDELAVGIRNGVITSRARIWHNAGQKWLPIEFHPHYRAALQQLEAGPADESAPALAAASLSAAPAFPEPTAATAPESPSTPVEPAAPVVRPVASQHRALFRPLGLLVIGGLVIAGAKVATFAVAFGTASAESGATMRATHAPATDSLAASIPAAAATVSAAPAVQESAPAPVTHPATQRTIAGGGVVRGPLQAPEPAPAVPSRQTTADTIPGAPPTPALDLTLPSALPSIGKPPAPTNATAPSTDSLAR